MEFFSVCPKTDCEHVLSQVCDENKWNSHRFSKHEFTSPCQKCDDLTENWVCLTCQQVFCSRFINSHAAEHFGESGHALALSFSDLSIWCYICDSYIKSPKLHAALNCIYQHKFQELLPVSREIISIAEENNFFEEKAEVYSALSQSEVSSTSFHPIMIFHNEACYNHRIPNHIEQPDRVKAIMKQLLIDWPDTAEVFRETGQCTDEDILLFHTEEYLSSLKVLFERSEAAYLNQGSSDGGSDSDSDMYQRIDSDTIAMWRTREAAYHAVGAVLAAVDQVMLPAEDPARARSVFCCVRPPGHHAERHRAMGFCFFSNAGIGAKYVQKKFGLRKVAVLDFDVHHGNGTEEGFVPDETLFYGSTHEKDNYPGTGVEPLAKGETAKSELHRRIVNRVLRRGPPSRSEFRVKWLEILSEMERFRPDFVIISAGFDAHEDDPLADCWLVADDFYWATQQVWQSCAKICPKNPPPLISVLEGGYDLPAIAASASAHVKALAAGPLAAAVVGSEVTAEGTASLEAAAESAIQSLSLASLRISHDEMKNETTA